MERVPIPVLHLLSTVRWSSPAGWFVSLLAACCLLQLWFDQTQTFRFPSDVPSWSLQPLCQLTHRLSPGCCHVTFDPTEKLQLTWVQMWLHVLTGVLTGVLTNVLLSCLRSGCYSSFTLAHMLNLDLTGLGDLWDSARLTAYLCTDLLTHPESFQGHKI